MDRRWVLVASMAALLLRSGPAESAVATIWYSRAAATKTTAAVWKVNGDGTGDVKITDGYWPRLSPNGRYLLFHFGTASNAALTSVYLHDLQTNAETLALDHQADYIVHYDFTRDSSRVVFDYSCGIYETDRDGLNGKTLVNSDCYDDAPMVNPVDGRLVFHNQGGILIANGDGSGKARVPNTQGGDYWPAWSADGEWISFGHYSGDVAVDYFKIHPDGSGRTTLTPFHGATGDAYNPRGIWTADGANLVASGTVFGVPGLYAIPTDGSGFVRRLAITAGAAPDFVGSVTGSDVSGVLVLPPTTTSTSSTTTTSTSSTSTSVSTTSSTSTTTSTIVPPAEICGNCLDDDGNGRIDGEDAACCPGASLGLTIARGRIKTKGATTKLTLSGGIGAATGLDQPHDVVLQIRGTAGELLCARLPAASFVTKGRSIKFRDPQHRVTSAGGIDLVVLRLPKRGAAKLTIKSKKAGLQAPGAGALAVTVGVASDGGARCGTATPPFAASKNGALHFP